MRSGSIPVAVRILILLVLMVGSFAIGWQSTPGPTASAQVAAPDSPDAVSGIHTCTISNVAVYENRMHIRCTTAAATTIYYFAYADTGLDGPMANRFLAAAFTAQSLGRQLSIGYYDSSTENPTGCLASDCRKLSYVAVLP